MPMKTHIHPSDVHGLGRLSIAAVAGLTSLVEALHRTIGGAPGLVGSQPPGPTKGITGFVYRSVHGVVALVGNALDAILVQIVPLLGELRSSPGREAVLAALNGVLGDYLAETGNPLAIAMRFRHDGQPLTLETKTLAEAIPHPTGKPLVMVHGLCTSDLQWTTPTQRRDPAAAAEAGVTLPSLLARELGYTPVYLHYNSGRHISSNGREFADLLETLVSHWPVPVQELAIVAHSMGGLVARSACHYAAIAGHAWQRSLKTLVFLGTPHHGAPLERGGNWIDLILAGSPYTAPFSRLGKIRSAGITDLRYGNLLDEDWEGRDRFEPAGDRRRHIPLPKGVRCYATAATTGKRAGDLKDRLLGDGLVPVDSALGRHSDPALRLALPASRLWVGYELNHMALFNHPAVNQRVRHWLAPRAMRKPSPAAAREPHSVMP